MTATAPAPGADTSDPGWELCPACQTLVYGRRLARNLRVCPDCGWYHPLGAPERIEQLFDAGSVEPIGPTPTTGDPLSFVDTRPYPKRVAAAREQTGLDEAVISVQGTIDGEPVVAAVMDFRFLGGSLGMAVGDLIVGAARHALATHTPLMIITASGGARMQEGALSLMQMARSSAVLEECNRAGVLTISMITDPTYGGVAASFATSCDVIIAEPGARLGFAGRRVIEQTIREELPERFQTAEFLLEHGLIDAVRPRAGLRAELGLLLRAASAPPWAPAEDDKQTSAPAIATEVGELEARDPWPTVRAARDLERPTTIDYISAALDDFEELHGDRSGGDCPAVVGGIGVLGGRPIVLVGHQKGHDVDELRRRNFGMAGPTGYRKAVRLFRLADKLGLPVVTLVDTPGAHPGKEAEERGQAMAIADALCVSAGLRVPVVSVVTGEGGSGGALALALANTVLVLEDAVYSVISPEGCASILWKDAAAASKAASALKVDARSLLELGVVDGVVREPPTSVADDPVGAAAALRRALIDALDELCTIGPDELVAHRSQRFERFSSTASLAGTEGETGPVGETGERT